MVVSPLAILQHCLFKNYYFLITTFISINETQFEIALRNIKV